MADAGRGGALCGETGRGRDRGADVGRVSLFVTFDSRQAKAHSAPSRETLLARWEAQSRRAEAQALSDIPDAALRRHDDGAEASPPSGAEVERILAAAVADAQQHKATFTHYELTRMVNRYLPDFLGGLSGEQVTRLLEELTSEALRPAGLEETVQLTAPEMVPVPQAYRRADGLSLWRRHGAAVRGGDPVVAGAG